LQISYLSFRRHLFLRLCTTICKSVRSARVSGNAHFGLVLPSTTTFDTKMGRIPSSLWK
jgi:hypothetical protein